MNRRVRLVHQRQPSFTSPPTPDTKKKPKKSVHFRENGSLEDVRFFLTSEKPIACQSDPTCSSIQHFLRCPNWPDHSLSGPVWMEDLELSENGFLLGTCQVANLAFEKQVKIRYTLDDWVSFKEISAAFKEPITNTWDRFAFQINCAHIRHLDFAILYTVDGRDFWDNNSDQNYQLDILHKVIEEDEFNGSSSSSDDDEELTEAAYCPSHHHFHYFPHQKDDHPASHSNITWV
ncbi:putative phosphatase regulatory subunit-domain-containing protein [Sporodiniella umbellata]|nr:putative phosphatase regulatory subunit-domain-containing protein [Sporodiniella umbellata]